MSKPFDLSLGIRDMGLEPKNYGHEMEGAEPLFELSAQQLSMSFTSMETF